MKTSRLSVILIATLGVSRVLSAGEQSRIPTAAECSASASHAAESQCLTEAFPLADAELKRQVDMAVRRFEAHASAQQSKTYSGWLKSSASDLQSAQVHWRGYRDANCAMVDGTVHGSDHGTAKVRCQLEMTEAMIRQVRGYASQAVASSEGAL